MSDKNWKAIERKVGEMLGLPQGSQRVGARGDSSFDVISADEELMVDNHALGVEVKYRKSLPTYIFDWLTQAREHIDTYPERIHSIVVAVGYRKTKREYIAVLPLEEYLDLRRKAARCPRKILPFKGSAKPKSKSSQPRSDAG